MKILKRLFLTTSLLVIGSHYLSASTVSFDQLAPSADLTVPKYNNDLNTVYVKVNSNIQTDNIADNTLQDLPVSSDFATNSSPRIRTFHGASCPFVYEGLLPVTSGSLTSNISAGTAYPNGYYVTKASATSKTYTASKDTYVDIDQNGDFQYTEVSNGASAPAVATNGIRLALVVTNGSQITSVTDLRRTTCTQASWDQVTNGTYEASLDDMMRFGKFRPSQDIGMIWGSQISFDTATTFIVRPGVGFFTQSQQYRGTSSDVSVPTTAANTSTATSGIDTGSISASTKYYVYLAADKSNDPAYSVIYSTNSSTPTGATNYRKIGYLRTDVNAKFSSSDMITTHRPGRLIQKKIAKHGNAQAITGTYTEGTSSWTTSYGTKILSVSIDPVAPGNRLYITASAYSGEGSTTIKPGGAILRNSDSNTLATCQAGNITTGPVGQAVFCHAEDRADKQFGTRIYDFYYGGHTAGTLYLNGLSGGANFSNTMSTYIEVEEYEE